MPKDMKEGFNDPDGWGMKTEYNAGSKELTFFVIDSSGDDSGCVSLNLDQVNALKHFLMKIEEMYKEEE